jgi:hypothetical protein
MTDRAYGQRLAQAPRPFPDETISSWLQRVAAANGATIEELIAQLRRLHRGAFREVDIFDYDLPAREVRLLAETCRVTSAAIRALDLRVRLPHLEKQLVLRFERNDWHLCRRHRARYRFCPHCLRADTERYVRWQWCLAAVTHCPIHGWPLRETSFLLGCPHRNPLCRGESELLGISQCQPCASVFAAVSWYPAYPLAPLTARNFVRSYVDAHRDEPPHRGVAGRMDARGFRTLVNDMLAIFAAGRAQFPGDTWIGYTSARDFTAIVCWALAPAAPVAQLERRRALRRRGAALWSLFFHAFSVPDLEEFDRRVPRWPRRVQRIVAPHLRLALDQARRHRWTTRSPWTTTAAIDSVRYTLEYSALRRPKADPALSPRLE